MAKPLPLIAGLALVAGLMVAPTGAGASEVAAPTVSFSTAAAFDVSRPLRDIAAATAPRARAGLTDEDHVFESKAEEVLEDREVVAEDHGYAPDGAVQSTDGSAAVAAATSFEGLSNQDNFNLYGGRVNPPDNSGDVGRNHYVEMINLVFAVYS